MSGDSFAATSELALAYDQIDDIGERWPTKSAVWYGLMCFVSVLNISTYFIQRAIVESHRREWLIRYEKPRDASLASYQEIQHLLGGVVVFISAFRSWFPTQLADPFVWYDSFVCSVLVHRMLQTVLELSLAALVANSLSVVDQRVFYLRACASLSAALDPPGSGLQPGGKCWHVCTQVALRFMVALVCASQALAAVGTLSGSCWWFIWSETCWGVALLAVSPSCLYLFVQISIYRSGVDDEEVARSPVVFVLGMLVFSLVYISFIAIADGPAWWSRHLSEEEHHVPAVPWSDTIVYALHKRITTHAWSVWWRPAAWQLFYVPVVNVIAIFLSHGPTVDNAEMTLPEARSTGPSGMRLHLARAQESDDQQALSEDVGQTDEPPSRSCAGGGGCWGRSHTEGELAAMEGAGVLDR